MEARRNSKWNGEGVLSATDIEALQKYYGQPKNEDFVVELKTNRGRDSLIFEEGESVEFFVKLNQPGYF